MATKSSISKQLFEKLLEEQKGQEILKWGEFDEGQIYEIINYEFIDTRNGKSCVITLSDDNRVWSPLALTYRLEKLDVYSHNFCYTFRQKGEQKDGTHVQQL